MVVLSIILLFVTTAFVYGIVPILFSFIRYNPIQKKKVTRLLVLNSVFGYIFFSLAHFFLDSGSVSNVLAAVTWYGVYRKITFAILASRNVTVIDPNAEEVYPDPGDDLISQAREMKASGQFISRPSAPSDPFDATTTTSAVSRDDYNAVYDQFLSEYPFSASLIGRTNPYTGDAVLSEDDYLSYLREKAFHVACEKKCLSINSDEISRIRRELSAQYKQRENKYFKQEYASRSIYAAQYRSRCRIFFSVFACVLLVAASGISWLVCSRSQARATAYVSDMLSVTFSDGYDAGYSDGYDACKSDNPIQSQPAYRNKTVFTTGVVGNVSSKVFHSLDCPYLPAKENQINFVSAGAAAAVGYDPCSHCGGS